MIKKDTQSAFFGADISTNETKELVTVLTSTTSSLSRVSKTICKIVIASEKFDTKEYAALSTALTDASYLFDDLKTFIDSFLNCMNDQNLTSSAKVSKRLIENLVHQLDTQIDFKVLETLSTKMAPVFGDSSVLIKSYAKKYMEVVKDVNATFYLLKDIFDDFAGSGKTVVISDAMTNHIKTLNKNIKILSSTTTATQILVVFMSAITTVVDAVVTNVQKTTSNSSALVASGLATIEKLGADSKISFKASANKLQQTLNANFEVFFANGIKYYGGNSEYQAVQTTVTNYIATVTTAMTNASAKFDSAAETFTTRVTLVVLDMQKKGSNNLKNITNILIDFQNNKNGQNSTKKVGFGKTLKCLSDQYPIKTKAAALSKQIGDGVIKCYAEQKSSASDLSKLYSFILEDFELNSRGIADKLCGCAINGNKTVTDEGIACLKKV